MRLIAAFALVFALDIQAQDWYHSTQVDPMTDEVGTLAAVYSKAGNAKLAFYCTSTETKIQGDLEFDTTHYLRRGPDGITTSVLWRVRPNKAEEQTMLANKGGSLLFFENSRRLFMQVLAAKKPTEIVVRVFLESDEAARTEIFPIFDSVATSISLAAVRKACDIPTPNVPRRTNE